MAIQLHYITLLLIVRVSLKFLVKKNHEKGLTLLIRACSEVSDDFTLKSSRKTIRGSSKKDLSKSRLLKCLKGSKLHAVVCLATFLILTPLPNF